VTIPHASQADRAGRRLSETRQRGDDPPPFAKGEPTRDLAKSYGVALMTSDPLAEELLPSGAREALRAAKKKPE
jgi:hypothetical protein